MTPSLSGFTEAVGDLMAALEGYEAMMIGGIAVIALGHARLTTDIGDDGRPRSADEAGR